MDNVNQRKQGAGLLICLHGPLYRPMAFLLLYEMLSELKNWALNKPRCAHKPPGKEQWKFAWCVRTLPGIDVTGDPIYNKRLLKRFATFFSFKSWSARYLPIWSYVWYPQLVLVSTSLCLELYINRCIGRYVFLLKRTAPQTKIDYFFVHSK